MTDKPTPKEMDDLFVEETGFDTDDFPAAIFDFARAVLAKWGQPVVAGDVDRADAVNLARNALTQYDCAITKKGVRVLAEAVLSMDSALTTPQPTQAVPPAGREPLTDAQIAEMMRDTWGCASIAPRHALEFARAVERAHGITQKGGS